VSFHSSSSTWKEDEKRKTNLASMRFVGKEMVRAPPNRGRVEYEGEELWVVIFLRLWPSKEERRREEGGIAVDLQPHSSLTFLRSPWRRLALFESDFEYFSRYPRQQQIFELETEKAQFQAQEGRHRQHRRLDSNPFLLRHSRSLGPIRGRGYRSWYVFTSDKKKSAL